MVFNLEKILEVAQFIAQERFKKTKQQHILYIDDQSPVHIRAYKTKIHAQQFLVQRVRKSQVGHFSLVSKYKVKVMELFEMMLYVVLKVVE